MPDESMVNETEPFEPSPGETMASGAEPDGGAPDAVAAPPATEPAGTDSLLSVTDALKQFGGYDLVGDAAARGDYYALQELTKKAQQAEQYRQQMEQKDFYSRLGQQLAPHADQLQKYFQQQQAPQAQERHPWEPPMDAATAQKYMQFVDRDPNSGMYASKPGIDPAVGKAVNEYQDYMTNFLQNPSAMITQAAEHVAKQTFEKQFAERFQEMQRQQEVTTILKEIDPWLYQRNADGSRVQNSGRPVYSPEGVAYMRALQQLDDAGVKNPAQKNQFAIQMVQAQIYASQAAAQNTQTRAAANQQHAIAGTQPNRNPLQALDPIARSQTPAATEPNLSGLSFREAAMNAFKAAGITDNDFTAENFS